MRLLIPVVFSVIFWACCTSSCVARKSLPMPVTDTVVVIDTPQVIAPPVDTARTDAFMLNLLKQYPPYFDSILANRKSWNVQVIYTQINRGSNGIPVLSDYYFNVDSAAYFYPASTVKLPVSLLALEKINELSIAGLDKYSTMITETGYSGQTAVYNDPTAFTGKPSVAHYIKKILMVSDNDAFNRLYEFIGQSEINDRLRNKGYPMAQVRHRLSLPLTAEENRHTNPIKFLNPANKLLFEQPLQNSQAVFSPRTDSLGKAHYRGDSLVNQPMAFSEKNRFTLEDLHQVLVSVVFPEKVPASRRFNITEDDRALVLKYMSQLPTESTFPSYAHDTAQYWPAYCKFLLAGSARGPMPPGIRIFNKVGDAYGQLTDVAYIIDTINNVEFLLSATIYCDKDAVINDDRYNYDDLGFPFMKHLGQVIYQYELNRKREITPDLSPFHFKYDR